MLSLTYFSRIPNPMIKKGRSKSSPALQPLGLLVSIIQAYRLLSTDDRYYGTILPMVIKTIGISSRCIQTNSYRPLCLYTNKILTILYFQSSRLPSTVLSQERSFLLCVLILPLTGPGSVDTWNLGACFDVPLAHTLCFSVTVENKVHIVGTVWWLQWKFMRVIRSKFTKQNPKNFKRGRAPGAPILGPPLFPFVCCFKLFVQFL